MMVAAEQSTAHLVSVYPSQHPYYARTGIVAVVQMRALRLYRDPPGMAKRAGSGARLPGIES